MRLSDESLKKSCYFPINNFLLDTRQPFNANTTSIYAVFVNKTKNKKKRMKMKRKFTASNKSDDKSNLYNTWKLKSLWVERGLKRNSCKSALL